MAWTDTTLKTAIQDVLENDETTFVNNLNNIIIQAEQRILLKVQLPNFRKNDTSLTLTSGNQYLSVPSDFLAPYSLAVDNSGYDYLIYKEVQFIRETYPDSTDTGVPRYYSLYDDEQIILGPTPNTNFATELNYFYSPASITSASTSWLGDHAERALLAACVYEGYKFMKGDPDLLGVYKQDMDDAIADLKLLGEGRSKTDEYRSA